MNTVCIVISIILTFANLTGSGMTLIAIIWGRLAKKNSYLLIAYLAVCDIVFGLSLFIRTIFYGSMKIFTCRVILNLANCSTFFSTSGILMLTVELYYNYKTSNIENGMALFKKWQHTMVGIVITILFVVTLTSLSTTFGTTEKEWIMNGIPEQECLNDQVMNSLIVRLFDGIVMMIYIATFAMCTLLFCEINLNNISLSTTEEGDDQKEISICEFPTNKPPGKEICFEATDNTDHNIINFNRRITLKFMRHEKHSHNEHNFLMETEFRNLMAKLVFAMVVLHTITWLPFLISAYLRHMSKIPVPDNVMHGMDLLYSVNSIAKFVLYSVLSSDLRMMYTKIICKFSCFNEKIYLGNAATS